jgi:hypothetical protein
MDDPLHLTQAYALKKVLDDIGLESRVSPTPNEWLTKIALQHGLGNICIYSNSKSEIKVMTHEVKSADFRKDLDELLKTLTFPLPTIETPKQAEPQNPPLGKGSSKSLEQAKLLQERLKKHGILTEISDTPDEWLTKLFYQKGQGEIRVHANAKGRIKVTTEELRNLKAQAEVNAILKGITFPLVPKTNLKKAISPAYKAKTHQSLLDHFHGQAFS